MAGPAPPMPALALTYALLSKGASWDQLCEKQKLCVHRHTRWKHRMISLWLTLILEMSCKLWSSESTRSTWLEILRARWRSVAVLWVVTSSYKWNPALGLLEYKLVHTTGPPHKDWRLNLTGQIRLSRFCNSTRLFAKHTCISGLSLFSIGHNEHLRRNLFFTSIKVEHFWRTWVAL